MYCCCLCLWVYSRIAVLCGTGGPEGVRQSQEEPSQCDTRAVVATNDNASALWRATCHRPEEILLDVAVSMAGCCVTTSPAAGVADKTWQNPGACWWRLVLGYGLDSHVLSRPWERGPSTYCTPLVRHCGCLWHGVLTRKSPRSAALRPPRPGRQVHAGLQESRCQPAAVRPLYWAPARVSGAAVSTGR